MIDAVCRKKLFKKKKTFFICFGFTKTSFYKRFKKYISPTQRQNSSEVASISNSQKNKLLQKVLKKCIEEAGCSLQFSTQSRIQTICETGIPVWAPKLWSPKNTFPVFFFQLCFKKEYVEVVINAFTISSINYFKKA